MAVKRSVVVGALTALLSVPAIAVPGVVATPVAVVPGPYAGCLLSGAIFYVQPGASPLRACPRGSTQIILGSGSSSGDITGVAAGSGLTGGGSSGDVALAVDPAAVQRRVSGVCLPGSAISQVAEDGTVTCTAPSAAGDITGVAAGSGLTGGGSSGDLALAVDPTVVQRRVSATCAGGAGWMSGIAEDGTVTCGRPHVQRITDSFDVAEGETTKAYECALGSVADGIGYQGLPAGVTIADSYPDSSNERSWSVRLVNISGATQHVTLVVSCWQF